MAIWLGYSTPETWPEEIKPPTVEVTPTQVILDNGGSIAFSANVSKQVDSYQWYMVDTDGTRIRMLNTTSPSYTVEKANHFDAGGYQVDVVFRENRIISSNVVTLSINGNSAE